MLYNIKPLHLHCVFHGIRFKVNKDWLSGIDSLFLFFFLAAILHILRKLFEAHAINENIIFASIINVKRETQIRKVMSIKVRLIIMNFLQFFVWGSWLISLGGYMGRELHFEGGQIGAIFATMGIASLIMPGIIGIIADKWFNAERLYGLCHIAGAACLFYASTATSYDQMYWAMLLNLLVYMPTLSLANTVSYNALEQYKCDLIKDFPPIRVWGTIGFICAMWAVDLTGFKNFQRTTLCRRRIRTLLGLYSFHPAGMQAIQDRKENIAFFLQDWMHSYYSKRKKMAIFFFLFSMLLGAALQITNTYGDLFLGSFASIPEFADSFGVKHSVILLSISQMSETLFILAIPFFLRHFGIKQVMLISMFAWVFRFGLVRLRRSGFRSVDADSFHDRVWYGVRLLQHFRFVVC